MPLISFKDFSFRYDNLMEPTLKDIHLDIEAGEKVLIAGPSGSGKSTLAHCINGLIPFTYKGELKGRLEIHGIKPYEKSIYEISKYVGTILQDQDGQFVGLSAGEDVAFIFENNVVAHEEMLQGVEKALQEVKMEDSRNETPRNLSGGQKQKVAIAGILATDADILLFDEPLANLDPVSGKRAMETINAIHKSSGKTVLIVEHRIEDVLEHDFDRIIIMNDGQIIADGHPDEILTTSLLPGHGLREPLYIEVLKHSRVSMKPEDKVSHIENTLRFKGDVLDEYQRKAFQKKTSEEGSILELKGVSYKYYQDAPYTIRDISFRIGKGEMLAILGNNGAGKSTLLRVISGIGRHQEGSILYKGQSIDKWSIRKRAEIMGYVMQNPNHMITKHMIFDEVAFGLRNFGRSEEEVVQRVEEALRVCGLYHYRKWPVSSLSYGQKKRVTIASILAMKPEIVILDEPTAGQDYRHYREFMEFLQGVKQQGISVVMITHDMHLALEYADRALVLSDGEIIAEDTVSRVLSNQEVIQRANLKETTIFKLAQLYQVEDVDGFVAYFMHELKGGEASE